MRKFFDIKSTALSLSLCLVVPFIFYWSNNWHMHSLYALLVSAGIIIGLGVILYALGFIIQYVIVTYIPIGSPKARLIVIDIIFMLLAAPLIVFLLLRTVEIAWLSTQYFIISAAVAVVFIVLYFIPKKLLNPVLFSWLGVACVSLVYGIIALGGDDIKTNDTKINFTNKPNVYLFVLESYHGYDVLEDVYNIDTAPLKRVLTANGFTYYPDTFSNSPATLLSMSDLFAMVPLDALGVGDDDAAPAVRRIIGGGTHNFVNKTFKANGYNTQSLYPSTYFMIEHGQYLDRVAIPVDTIYNTLQPIASVNNVLARAYRSMPKSLLGEIVGNGFNLQKELSAALSAKEQNQPYFISMKMGACHTPRNHRWTQAEQWVQSGKYQEKFMRSQKLLTSLVEQIVAADPDAVIILIGDHGVRRYRALTERAKTPITSQQAFDDLLKANNISKADFAKDCEGTFLAIRMPGKGDISHGYAISHRNLFWHIFAELSGDEQLLSLRSPSISRYKDLILAEEGKTDNIKNVLEN